MRILLVSQYFWPESFLVNDLVRVLVAQGNVVDVYTGKPNYPDGEIYEGYSDAGYVVDESFDDDVTVYRVPLRPRGSGGGVNLIRNYVSFIINGLRYSEKIIKKNKRYDVVFFFAPSPITSALPAIYLKWRLKAHLAIWVQDLWPDSLRATGFVRNRLVLQIVGLLVRGIYYCADTLLIQSEAFRSQILRYSRADKLIYYPNSCMDKSRAPRGESALPQELIQELEDNFCVVFSGNLGSAQSVETLVKSAERLRHLPDVRLVLVGSGSMLEWIKEQKRCKGLANLLIAGRYPYAEMPGIYSRASALLATLRRDEIFSYTIPSKIQAYLAAGRPVIAAIDGEGARVIKDAQAGFTCEAEDDVGLSACIEELYNMPVMERESLGVSGRRYFLDNFEMSQQSRRLIEILESRLCYEGRR